MELLGEYVASCPDRRVGLSPTGDDLDARVTGADALRIAQRPRKNGEVRSVKDIQRHEAWVLVRMRCEVDQVLLELRLVLQRLV